MRVLLVHQLFQLRGGAARVLFGIEASLLAHGDQVAIITATNDRDEPASASSFFKVDGFDSRDFKGASLSRRLRWAARGLYSIPARRTVRQAVAQFHPDVALVLKPDYQLSASVLAELSSLKLPVLQWLVDFKPWCTQGQFYNQQLQQTCTRCASGNHVHALRYRCGYGSLFLSLYGALARSLTTTIMRLPWSPSAYVTPTEANRQYAAETVGLPLDSIHTSPHPINLSRFAPGPGTGEGPLLFYGGLATHKGIWTLAKAIACVPKETLEVYGVDELGLAGSFRRHTRTLGVANRIRLDTDMRMGERLMEKIRHARLVIIPSECHNMLDYTLLESMAMGKAVLVGDLGGNRDFITPGHDGLAFEAGNADSLADAIRVALADPSRLTGLGHEARSTVERRLNPERFYANLRDCLESAIARHRH